jgi:hypothetical protein
MKPLHRRIAVGFFWFFLLAVVIMAMINQTVGAEWVIPALCLSVLVKIVPLLLYQSEYGWFHPLIFGALYSIIGFLRSFPTYAWGLEWNDGLPGYSLEKLAGLVSLGLVLGVIGQIEYYVGFIWGPRLPIPQLHFVQRGYIGGKAILIVILVLLLFAIYISSQGGLVAHLLFLAQGRRFLINEGLLTGEWDVLVRFGILACLLWLVTDHNAIRQPLFWISAILALISQYFVIGSRSAPIIFLIIGLIAWMMKERKFSATAAIIFSVVAVALIGLLGDFRTSIWSGSVDWSVLTEADLSTSIKRGISEMQYRSSGQNPLYPILARVPDEIPLEYGRSYLAVFGTPIPRAFWPDKPRTTGNVIGEIFLNTLAPIPPDPIAEAYWNFHIPGILAVHFIYGVFHQWLIRLFQRYRQEPIVIIFYSYTLFWMNPTVLSIVSWLQVLFLLVLLSLLFTKISLQTIVSPP